MKAETNQYWRAFKLVAIVSFFVGLSASLTTCSPSISPIDEILATGEIRVVTRENPATYTFNNGQATGFEYDLAKKFAEYLDVELNIYSSSVSQALQDIENGRAHIAAAGLSITEARKLDVDFGPDYQEVTQQLIGRRDKKQPKDLSDLPDFKIAVLADSSHLERLIQLQANFPDLEWDTQNADSTIELMQSVKNGDIELTIVDSNEFAVTQRYFPKLSSLIELSEIQRIAWAMPQHSPSLQKEINTFFTTLESSGELDQLKELHFGYINSFDYFEVTNFKKDYENRFPEFRNFFLQAGIDYGIDWKLLAAVSYQESHWRKNAVSPTGVKGLMMLTKNTAAEMNVTDRKDPQQSIDGGARYLLKMQAKIPQRIQFPDRLWFALAGYNVGFGHLEDARILTQRAGKNADLWSDVREYLPLLSEKKYYSTLRFGKARGSEPVKYVENIRDYHDLLIWLTRNENMPTIDDEELSEPDDETLFQRLEKLKPNVIKSLNL